MESVELISITRLSRTIVEVKLLVGSREIHHLAMELEKTGDASMSSIRQPERMEMVGVNAQVTRPIFEAVLAFAWTLGPPMSTVDH